MPIFDKLKSKLDTYSSQAQQKYFPGQHHNAPPPPIPQQSGTRMVWPPKLLQPPTVLGEVRDTSNRKINRDGGRSIRFNGRLYYMFGDTFCFDHSDDFKGVANNTIASIPDPSDPTKSHYWDGKMLTDNFVPHTPAEAQECEEGKKDNRRLVNWVFGGVVEREDGGWLWFDKIRTEGAAATKCFGMGVAKVLAKDDGTLTCERVDGENMVFGEHEPRFFSITAYPHTDGYVYGFGSLGNELGNKLARVPINADFTQRSSYEFFAKGGASWVKDFQDPNADLEDVIAGMSQGGILYMPDHGPAGKPFVWFGVNKFMSGDFYVGAAERIEGPYDIHEIGHGPKIMPKSDHLYCLYPHDWASDFGNGMVCVSWSDDGELGGKVAAGRYYFEME
ncbi:hypothetical protein EJ05DRAFT_276114 [Pseudovirgaria hyperparasitica]|uniref:DUF4185 domain-containing protein n=1 Tax=Pseudovirgaria hyperparasitica TaxID=470096 RepID=A0A6A6WBK4_9PEZI|nr:uncharacterized protein EJ05DRAFT_276114 [Pseudovirgaria hyperparasitica]KAF2760228.1 hypothetical protein EJ05DRAFT_276114 [Pseudovirgaria hyperparasitica]